MIAPPEAPVAALAGRYEVERGLGQGGMAAVFLARDLKHHRQVAIKVVKTELAASLGTERFLREIDTAASLTHPHILPVHDSGEAGGFLYYVMPYVEGESLRDRLAREGQLPLDEALRIAREVADALSYAHAHAQWLANTRWYRGDCCVGPEVAEDLARILAQAGYADEALDEIERLLSKPPWLSVHTLRLDPRWDPIRTHPRFKALLEKDGS